eukprot:6531683-Alexandrium_andersonii.AAC.1
MGLVTYFGQDWSHLRIKSCRVGGVGQSELFFVAPGQCARAAMPPVADELDQSCTVMCDTCCARQ